MIDDDGIDLEDCSPLMLIFIIIPFGLITALIISVSSISLIYLLFAGILQMIF